MDVTIPSGGIRMEGHLHVPEPAAAPTLLIAGGADTIVLELNRRAMETLHCENRLEIVEGATHLLEEPGAFTEVAPLARDWFVDHLLDRTIPPVEGTQE